MRFCTRCGFEFGQEVTRQIVAHADDELAVAFLRHTEFPSVFDLTMDAVAQCPGFGLDASKVIPTRCIPQARNILHHKDARLEELDVAERFEIEIATGIVHKTTRTMIGPITLARSGKALARRTADDDVHITGVDELRERIGWERVAAVRERTLAPPIIRLPNAISSTNFLTMPAKRAAKTAEELMRVAILECTACGHQRKYYSAVKATVGDSWPCLCDDCKRDTVHVVKTCTLRMDRSQMK